jgi:hypothetical protein
MQFNAKDGNIKNCDKMELIARKHGVGLDVDGTIKQFCDIRLYMSKGANSSTVYANAWIWGKDTRSHDLTGETQHGNGTGKAGGYGYCKQSAAVHVALCDAGLSDFGSVAGVGMDAVNDILERVGVEIFGLTNLVVLG